MAKGASISGFPEWLPSERVVEQRVIDTLREVFELNGFIGIETRAVEQGSSLLKKGETSKEIYLLSRLQEVGHESDTPIEDRLGLHFDLTVPLSRYVVEHSGDLASLSSVGRFRRSGVANARRKVVSASSCRPISM